MRVYTWNDYFKSRDFWVSVVIAALILLSGALMHSTTRAAPPLEEVEECVAFAKAGNAKIYRCEDWQMAAVCYVNEIGMMFCLRD